MKSLLLIDPDTIDKENIEFVEVPSMMDSDFEFFDSDDETQ